MGIIDHLKWDAEPGTYVKKLGSQELSTFTQLIVSESQEAILLKDGKQIGTFTAGRYTLDTNNIPFLRTLINAPFGGKSPFTAEVWFIDKRSTLDVKWGLSDAIQIMDPKYNILLPVKAFGQLGLTIENASKFLFKVVGTLKSYEVDDLNKYFRGIVVTEAKDLIAKKLVRDKISILEISAHLNEISDFIRDGIKDDLSEYGIALLNFKVMSINAPEDDPSVVRLRDALSKRAEMNIVGYNYQQERSFDTLETAAGNSGTGGTLIGAGVGLGVGLGLGGAMGAAASSMATEISAKQNCPSCAQPIVPNSKFCNSCGASNSKLAPEHQAPHKCDKCGTTATHGAKFCPTCGDPFNICSKCGTDNRQGSTICSQCSTPMPFNCGNCGESVSVGAKFCPSCGKKFGIECKGCGETVSDANVFCPRCGNRIQGQLA